MSLVALRTSRSGRAAGARARDLASFLPTTRDEMRARAWDELDVLIVTGDAYVDHPAFGPVLVARFLAGRGLRVGIVAQPRWDEPRGHRPHGPAAPLRGRERRQPRFDAQQAHRAEEGAVGGSVLARRTHQHAARTGRRSCTRTCAARPSLGCPSSSGASRRRSGGSPTTTTGATRSAARSCSTARRTCSSSAWASSPRGRSRGASAPASRSRRSPTCAGPPTSGRIAAPGRARRRGPAGTSPTASPSFCRRTKTSPDDKVAFAKMSRMLQYETNAHNARPLLQPHGDQAVYFNPPAVPLAESEMDALYDLPFVAAPALGLRRRADPRVRDGQELDRDDARLLRRVHVLQHHRARGPDHPEPQRRQRLARGAGALTHGGVPRHDHRRRRPHREHVQDAVQGRRDRARMPAPLVRAPRASARTW